ncbi:MAG: hypothetical protein A2005_12810 [Desulfuromonadales bacterium GWC2_61_20]|nr:MAG: hypothetical protein A2005_12810 [Desulfuromonadales bacterium GWC2_61_20]HAD04191.1 hypothetical protein [Desulfuromonas sp.]HBT83434.1 hypothetical protein [Desulfuromonas sp.]
MSTVYACDSCGEVSETSGYLCQPKAVGDRESYCHTNPESDVCVAPREELPFECASCGRPAATKDAVCDPRKVR